MRCTLRIEVDGPAQLAQVIEAVERLGHHVECPVFSEWSRLRARDSYLRKAHERMPGPHSWTRSVELAAEVLYFETRIWPRWSHLDKPPECTEVRRFLFMARKLSRMPASDRQIHTIATKSNTPCDFSEKRFSSAPDP